MCEVCEPVPGVVVVSCVLMSAEAGTDGFVCLLCLGFVRLFLDTVVLLLINKETINR